MNLLNQQTLTDMETCYKVFRRDIIQSLSLTENVFGTKPEITEKLAKQPYRFHEVAISYNGKKLE